MMVTPAQTQVRRLKSCLAALVDLVESISLPSIYTDPERTVVMEEMVAAILIRHPHPAPVKTVKPVKHRPVVALFCLSTDRISSPLLLNVECFDKFQI
jgi:hypothetical protein